METIWVRDILAEAVELCGLPHELMSDNGTPFVAIARSMLSRFQRTLDELRIRHIRTQFSWQWRAIESRRSWRLPSP
jgi:hypothetical protein